MDLRRSRWFCCNCSRIALADILMWRSINQRKKFLPRDACRFPGRNDPFGYYLCTLSDNCHFERRNHAFAFESVAPIRTMTALANALLIGSVLILPALFYLYYSFQKEEVVLIIQVVIEMGL